MPTKPSHLPRLRRRKRYSSFSRYQDYRQEIREDCQQRCVYCDLHETEAGGERSMTLDHFRPSGGRNPKYPELKNVPTNLVWACQPCNTLKGDLWPAFGLPGNPTINGRAGFIDPFMEDRREYFELQDDGSFKPIKDPAEYIIFSLELNRPFFKFIRRRRDLIYTALSVIEQYLQEQIILFNKVMEDPHLSSLEKARLAEERKEPQLLLEVIDGLDEALRLTW